MEKNFKCSRREGQNNLNCIGRYCQKTSSPLGGGEEWGYNWKRNSPKYSHFHKCTMQFFKPKKCMDQYFWGIKHFYSKPFLGYQTKQHLFQDTRNDTLFWEYVWWSSYKFYLYSNNYNCKSSLYHGYSHHNQYLLLVLFASKYNLSKLFAKMDKFTK